jgi:hypothetical protein
MKLTRWEDGVILAPEGDEDEAFIRRLFGGRSSPGVGIREGCGVVTREEKPPYEKTRGDFPLLTRLSEREQES